MQGGHSNFSKGFKGFKGGFVLISKGFKGRLHRNDVFFNSVYPLTKLLIFLTILPPFPNPSRSAVEENK